MAEESIEMAVRESFVSSDDAMLLSALVEHSKQRREAPRLSGRRPAPSATMNTRVEFEDLDSGERRRVWLVHPSGVDPQAGRISVLSPVGRALLGKRAGQEVQVRLPSGDSRDLLVIDVHEEDGR